MATVKAIRKHLAEMTKQACAAKKLQNALTYHPRLPQDSQLPLAVVAVRQAVFDSEEYGSEEVKEDREYDILIHVANARLSPEGKAEAEVEDYMELMKQYFFEHRFQEVDGEGIFITPQGDAGIDQFEYGDGQTIAATFLGITFSVTVESEETIETEV